MKLLNVDFKLQKMFYKMEKRLKVSIYGCEYEEKADTVVLRVKTMVAHPIVSYIEWSSDNERWKD